MLWKAPNNHDYLGWVTTKFDEITSRESVASWSRRKSLRYAASAGRRNALIPPAPKRFVFYDTLTHVSLFYTTKEKKKQNRTADRNRLPVLHTQNLCNRRHASVVTAERDRFTSEVGDAKRCMYLKISEFSQGTVANHSPVYSSVLIYWISRENR